MTDEELDSARAEQAAKNRAFKMGSNDFFTPQGALELAKEAARLARDGWTPPVPVDPDLLEARDLTAAYAHDPHSGEWHREQAQQLRSGQSDNIMTVIMALEGIKRGRELAAQEAERVRETLAGGGLK